MALTVFKYTLDPVEPEQDTKRILEILHVAPTLHPDFAKQIEFGMPADRKAQVMAEAINVWCKVDDEIDKSQFPFEVYGTGHRIPKGRIYGGTAVMLSGLVWHVFVPETALAYELT